MGMNQKVRLSPRHHSADLGSLPVQAHPSRVLSEKLATFCFSELLSVSQSLLEDTFCMCLFCEGLFLCCLFVVHL